MDKTVVEQKIYKYEQGDDTKENPWTIGELKNAVVNSESINNYYCTDKHKSAWLFADTEKSELDNELWRKCENYTYNGYEIYASNRGRIRVEVDTKTIKICELYEEISKNPKKEEYKEQLTKPLFNALIKNQENHIGYLLAKIPADIKRNANHEYFGPYVYQMVADAWLKGYTYNPYKKTNKQIHHITNDGYDNRPENLIILKTNEHDKIPRDGQPDPAYYPGKYDKK